MCSCCLDGEQSCWEKPTWWQSDPDLCHQSCCPTAYRQSHCGSKTLKGEESYNFCRLQQSAAPKEALSQQANPQGCPQHTTAQNQAHPQQGANPQQCCLQMTVPRSSCPRPVAPSQSRYPTQNTSPEQCETEQTSWQNPSQPSSKQQYKGILRRTSRVTFDPAAIKATENDGAEHKSPSAETRRGKWIENSTHAQPAEDNSDPKTADSLRSTGSTAGAPMVMPSLNTEDNLEPIADVKTGKESRAYQSKSIISLERNALQTGATFHGRQGEHTPDRTMETGCGYPSGTNGLTVVGHQCELGPRGTAQKKWKLAPDNTVASAGDKLTPVGTDVSSPATQQPSMQSVKPNATNSDSQYAMRQSSLAPENREACLENASSEDTAILHKEQKTCNMDNNVGLNMSLREGKTSASDRSKSSFHREELQVNPRAASRNHKENSRHWESPLPEQDIQQTNSGTARTPESSPNLHKDQKAFFIDIASGESCSIQSLSAESASFRGNRTLLLRQLLSQRKIVDATDKRKISSPHSTRRRRRRESEDERRPGQMRSNEMMCALLLNQTTGGGKHNLPAIPGGPTEMPLVIQHPQSAHFGVSGSAWSVRSRVHMHDLQHQEGFPQVGLRHRSADTSHQTESAAQDRPHGTGLNLAAMLPLGGDQMSSAMANHQQKSSIGGCHYHCSGHHRRAHTPWDNPSHMLCETRKEHIDLAHTMLHEWDPSLSDSQHGNGRWQAPHGNASNLVHKISAGSMETVTDASSTQELVSSDCSTQSPTVRDTDSVVPAPAKLNDHSASKTDQSFVKEPETVPMSPPKSRQHVPISLSAPYLQILSTPELAEPAPLATKRALHKEPHHPINTSNTESQGVQSTSQALGLVKNSTSSSGTVPDRIPAQWLDSAAVQQRMSAGAETLLAAESRPSPTVQAGASLTPAMPDTRLPTANSVTKRPDWREVPSQLRHTDNRSREAPVPLSDRAQKTAQTSLAAAEAKNWTSVMLMSPQNMEMSFSLSTHLPSVSDRRQQQRQCQRAAQEAKVSTRHLSSAATAIQTLVLNLA